MRKHLSIKSIMAASIELEDIVMTRSIICTLAFATAVEIATPASAKDAQKDTDHIGNRNVGKGPVISEYVNRVGQNLARNSDLTVPVTIKVVDDPQVNALALPGEFVFVHTGLLLKADSEAEVAGLAPCRSFSGGWGGYAARQAAGLAVPLTFLKYSQDFEREADLLGLHYLFKAGYDPAAMVDFFEKLEAMEKAKPGTMAELFRSQLITSERVKSTQKDIQDLLKSRPQYAVTTSEFQEVKARLQQVARKNSTPKGESGPALRRTSQRPAPLGDSDDRREGESANVERPTLRRETTSDDLQKMETLELQQ